MSFRDIEDYVQHLDRDYLVKLADTGNSMGAIGPDLETSVMIPVSSEERPEDVVSTIRFLTLDQTLAKERYELVLNINHQTDNSSGEASCLKIRDAITAFQSEHQDRLPEIKSFVSPYSKVSIGEVRKELADVILERILRRGNGTDYNLLSVDADVKGGSKNFLRGHVDNLNIADCSHGILDWDDRYFPSLPELHVGTRFMQYAQAYHRNRCNYIPTPGGNFGFKASVYSRVNGYTHDKSFIDRIIGRKMVALGNNYSNFAFSPRARIRVDSRRAINAVLQGLAPIEQWDGKSFEKELGVRLQNQDQLRAAIDNFRGGHEIKGSVERVIYRTIAKYREWGLPIDDVGVIKALNFLGIEFEVRSDGLRIVSMNKLLDGLERFSGKAG